MCRGQGSVVLCRVRNRIFNFHMLKFQELLYLCDCSLGLGVGALADVVDEHSLCPAVGVNVLFLAALIYNLPAKESL